MIKKKKEVESGRIKTGIVGFDSLCEGGLVSDSLNLLIGNAGSGKTTFILQFLYNGVKDYDERGLYISFEPELKDIFKASIKQGMDVESMVNDEDIHIVKFDPNSSIKEIQSKLSKLIIEKDIRRVCLDPINVYLIGLDKSINIRKQIYDLLSWLKKLNVCVLVAGESDEDFGGRYNLSEEVKFCKYAVDGVIELFSSGMGEKEIEL
jgi:circadian clock protein KaiC